MNRICSLRLQGLVRISEFHIRRCFAMTNHLGDEELKRDDKYGVVRIDTHGRKALVKDMMSLHEAKSLESYYDSLNHHQGYFVIRQQDIAEEINKL